MLKRIKAYFRISKLLRKNERLAKQFESKGWIRAAKWARIASEDWSKLKNKVLFSTDLAEYVLDVLDVLDKRYYKL